MNLFLSNISIYVLEVEVCDSIINKSQTKEVSIYCHYINFFTLHFSMDPISLSSYPRNQEWKSGNICFGKGLSSQIFLLGFAGGKTSQMINCTLKYFKPEPFVRFNVMNAAQA